MDDGRPQPREQRLRALDRRRRPPHHHGELRIAGALRPPGHRGVQHVHVPLGEPGRDGPGGGGVDGAHVDDERPAGGAVDDAVGAQHDLLDVAGSGDHREDHFAPLGHRGGIDADGGAGGGEGAGRLGAAGEHRHVVAAVHQVARHRAPHGPSPMKPSRMCRPPVRRAASGGPFPAGGSAAGRRRCPPAATPRGAGAPTRRWRQSPPPSSGGASRRAALFVGPLAVRGCDMPNRHDRGRRSLRRRETSGPVHSSNRRPSPRRPRALFSPPAPSPPRGAARGPPRAATARLKPCFFQ